MLIKTELEQKVAVKYRGSTILGKIVKVYGEENPYAPGTYARINVSTPHGSIIKTGIAWCYELTDDEAARLKEYEEDAAEKNRLYEFDEQKNT